MLTLHVFMDGAREVNDTCEFFKTHDLSEWLTFFILFLRQLTAHPTNRYKFYLS